MTESEHHSGDTILKNASPSLWKVYFPAIGSFVFLLLAIGIDEFDWPVPAFSSKILFLFSYLLVGWKVLKISFQKLLKGDVFNEFFLMSSATIGAFYLGEYAEGVAVMLFYTIGELFRDYGEEYIEKYRPDLQTIKLIRSIRLCRTPALGGHKMICQGCGDVRFQYHSCGNNQCPQCQGIKRRGNRKKGQKSQSDDDKKSAHKGSPDKGAWLLSRSAC